MRNCSQGWLLFGDDLPVVLIFLLALILIIISARGSYSWYFISTYYVPTMKDLSHIDSLHLPHWAVMWHYRHPHFTDNELKLREAHS